MATFCDFVLNNDTCPISQQWTMQLENPTPGQTNVTVRVRCPGKSENTKCEWCSEFKHEYVTTVNKVDLSYVTGYVNKISIIYSLGKHVYDLFTG